MSSARARAATRAARARRAAARPAGEGRAGVGVGLGPSCAARRADLPSAAATPRPLPARSWQLANHHDHTVAQGTSSGSTVCVHPGLYEFTALDS